MAVWEEGLLCPPERLFADASEVPTSNKATATTIRADLVMPLLQAPLHIELWVFQIIIKKDPASRIRTSGGPFIHARHSRQFGDLEHTGQNEPRKMLVSPTMLKNPETPARPSALSNANPRAMLVRLRGGGTAGGTAGAVAAEPILNNRCLNCARPILHWSVRALTTTFDVLKLTAPEGQSRPLRNFAATLSHIQRRHMDLAIQDQD